MLTLDLQIGIFILSGAALWFSIWSLAYNLNQARKWYKIAQGYKETIRIMAKDLSEEEQALLFSKFVMVEKQNERY